MRSFLISLVVLFAAETKALDIPQLKSHVNDYGNLLTTEQVLVLETKLASHEKKTSNQIVILTISSLEGENLEQFSHRVASAWKLGQKGKDNGVLLFIAVKERKSHVEVGYGLEGRLNDARCGRILDEALIPNFKQQRWFDGVNLTIDKIIQSIKGEYKAENSAAKKELTGKLIGGLIVGVIFLSGIAGFIHWSVGGIVGAILGFLIGLFFGRTSTGIVCAIIGFPIGCVSRFILEAWAESKGGGSWSSGGSSSGRSWGGGGGSFGGGGASRGW
jgi:uncharacterized protein